MRQEPVSSSGRPQTAISADGTQVAFAHTEAVDPVDSNEGDGSETFGWDIYVRDRTHDRTVLISRNGDGQAASGESMSPSISRNGRYVAFSSTARDIPAAGVDPFPQREIYVCDRDPDGDGVLDEQRAPGVPDYRYIRLGRSQQSSPPNVGQDVYSNQDPSISNDGSLVSWTEVYAPDSATVEGTNGVVNKLGKDARGRLFNQGHQHVLNSWAGEVDIAEVRVVANSDREVVFLSSFARGGQLIRVNSVNIRTRVIRWIDRDNQGNLTNGAKSNLAVSDNGRTVVWSNSVQIEGSSLVVVRAVDRDVDADGRHWPRDDADGYYFSTVSKNGQNVAQEGTTPSVSGDGRYVAFATPASGMHNGVDGMWSTEDGVLRDIGVSGVVVRDLWRDREAEQHRWPRIRGELASPRHPNHNGDRPFCGSVPMEDPTDSCEGDNNSIAPVLSADGRVVAYWSLAADLVAEAQRDVDAPADWDVYVREFRPTITAARYTDAPLTVRIGSRHTATINVSHVGFGPVRLGDVELVGPDRGEFTVTSDTCSGAVLHARHPSQPQNNCQVYVRFEPDPNGRHGATLARRHATLVFRQQGSSQVHTVELAVAVDHPPNGLQTMSLDPAVAVRGRVTTITGTGFAGDVPVNVVIADVPDARSVIVRTDRSGRLRAQLPVPMSVMPGRWPVEVSVPGSDIELTQLLLVLEGTQQPPNFNTRR